MGFKQFQLTKMILSNGQNYRFYTSGYGTSLTILFASIGSTQSLLSYLGTQRALAGLESTTQEDIVPLIQQRNDWLSLQHFCASLWLHCGRDEYVLYALWIIRYVLEDWPNDPPSFSSIPGIYENSPAYHVLNVEAALVWIIKVAGLMYRETRVWGQNGNPHWSSCSGTPGEGGTRWHAVDDYDIEHGRWDLWKAVLHEIDEWCDQEVSEG
ncbi:hypothetical protein RhiJN_03562 [Ceratobasidium sp. AG-Ba]|nr:hypothetical protein RhiJN_03562 [Ceratobasidium sp. AG-Ba]